MKTYSNWHQAPNRYNALAGGSVKRLATYRAKLARSLETIRACRTPADADAFIVSAGYTSPLTHRFEWMGSSNGDTLSQLQRAREEKRGYISAEWSLVDGWRDVGDVADILGHSRVYASAYYADADAYETYVGHVWQLPARDGVSQYVPGYIEREGRNGDGRQSGYVVLSVVDGRLDVQEDKEEAARIADGLAERMAEDAREYSERWREAQHADSEREDARGMLQRAHATAHAVVDAWRAQRRERGELVPEVCALLRRSLADARDDMRDALQDIAKHTRTIADLDMTGEF